MSGVPPHGQFRFATGPAGSAPGNCGRLPGSGGEIPITTGRSSWHEEPSEIPVDPPVNHAPPETDERLEDILVSSICSLSYI